MSLQNTSRAEKCKMIVLMGPTACGKTALAMALCRYFPLEIISVDSALVYRGMDIGTAKPSLDERALAPHRLIDCMDPTETYSAGQFCSDVLREIGAVQQAQRIPLLVGGTMLYLHRLFFGLASLPAADAELRNRLAQEAVNIGWEAMHQRLAAVDPLAAQKIKPQDPQRIQRALEVFYLTGTPLSALQKNNTHYFSPEEAVFFALIPEDRAWLHARIAARFESMLANGFIDEVRMLKNRGDLSIEMPAMRIVGYRQVWEYLEGRYDMETMKHKAIAATRQLAKRQLTWLRRWQNLVVVDPQLPKKAQVKVVKECLQL